MEYTEDDFRELASQLSHPKGEMGIEIGLGMNTNNAPMIDATLSRLRLFGGEHILELGHGNGNHIPELLSQAKNLKYSGLEISELMHREALKFQESLQSQAAFYLYPGDLFPFGNQMFDRILTINTVYFWRDPETTIKEMYRTLRPGGALHITFAQKATMAKMPFTKYGFQLYDSPKMTTLLERHFWKSISIENFSDQIHLGPNSTMTRDFSIASAVK